MRAAALALLALLLAGCGAEGPARPAGPTPTAPARVLQAANGPVAANPATSPLSVRLARPGDPIHLRFGKPPRSGLVFDLDTGEVLWRRNPTRILPIASLTKMMSALVVTAAAGPDEKVRASKHARRFTGSGLGVWPKRGKRIRLETLLNAMLLVSANDAANVLAEHVSGTEGRFVSAMNRRAAAMGLTCTRFASPSGIVDTGNHSCAADLAAMARAVLDEPRLAAIVRRRRVRLPFPIKGGRLELYSTNPLLRRGYPGVIGVKTGFTDAAGRCFVGAIRHDGRRIGVILLDSPDPGEQARKLLDGALAGH